MNLVTVALPNLIAPELVITYPMSSMSGYVNYIEYVAGVDKGGVKEGQMFNSPFALGDYDSQYTASKVSVAATGSIPAIAWTPVVPGTVEIVVGAVTYVDNGAGAFIKKEDGVSISKRLVTVAGEDGRYSGVPAKVEVVAKKADGAVTPTGTINYTTGAITGITANPEDAVSVEYQYNNVVVPQNSLPTIKAEMKSMPLLAKARRIAVFYSQMAAFQAKTDYGFDLGDSLAEQAVGQLSYEIDTEVVQLLADNAAEDADLVWSRTLPVGVNFSIVA